jgi:hypothetical protein
MICRATSVPEAAEPQQTIKGIHEVDGRRPPRRADELPRRLAGQRCSADRVLSSRSGVCVFHRVGRVRPVDAWVSQGAIGRRGRYL